MIPLILGAASGIYNIASGIHQQNLARKMQANRPQYNIPKGIYQNQQMYQNLANTTRLPGQSILENNIGSQGAGSINAAMQAGGSSSDILSAVSGINQNQNQAYNEMAQQGAQFQAMNRDKLSDANQTLAGYQDQEFDYNKNQPYMMKLARKQALQQSGGENISSGLSGMANLAATYMGQGGGNTSKSPSVNTNRAWTGK